MIPPKLWAAKEMGRYLSYSIASARQKTLATFSALLLFAGRFESVSYLLWTDVHSPV